MQWFKFYGTEYLSDPKTRNFTAQQHSCWIHLLCFAASASRQGIVEYLTEENLMLTAGIDPMSDEWDKTIGVLDLFASRGMVTRSDAAVTLCNWNKRQEIYMTGAERQARYRERQKRDAGVTRVTSLSDARIEEKRIEENINTSSNEENAKMLETLAKTKKALISKKIF